MLISRLAAFSTFSLIAFASPDFVSAQEIKWEVENPLRSYKRDAAFKMHYAAYSVVRGLENSPPPADLIWQMEKILNQPACSDPATPVTCAKTMVSQAKFEERRLGWAHKTKNDVCYDQDSRPRRYLPVCVRDYSISGSARNYREDFILPDSHTVRLKLSAPPAGNCIWKSRNRTDGNWTQSVPAPCANFMMIERVPYSLDKEKSGAVVKVELPGGMETPEINVIVEDVLVVALGDSFASGEGNPDTPISFHPSSPIIYESQNCLVAQPKLEGVRKQESGKAEINSLALPRRIMAGNTDPCDHSFRDRFFARSANWLSADCHRSQYAYPARVAMTMALENSHRSVTFINLACTGADIVAGLFNEREPRERIYERDKASVPAQFDQLTDLLCTNAARSSKGYKFPLYKLGNEPEMREITKSWCAAGNRKRPIDMVLLSVGGNDVGFSALVAYAITERASDLAPIAGLIGNSIRFDTDQARKYLNVLDERMEAVKSALWDGFGVKPEDVIQTSYEPVHFDEHGQVCNEPAHGLDVHPGFSLDSSRMQDLSKFMNDMFKRLACIREFGAGCPNNLATKNGTGFQLVVEHQEAFKRRGFCARSPSNPAADNMEIGMVEYRQEYFVPYSPAYYRPYAPRQRLVRNPNDAFMTANSHYETPQRMTDRIQPVWASLLSGAMHPTAEGHAVVADHVMPYVRKKFPEGARR